MTGSTCNSATNELGLLTRYETSLRRAIYRAYNELAKAQAASIRAINAARKQHIEEKDKALELYLKAPMEDGGKAYREAVLNLRAIDRELGVPWEKS